MHILHLISNCATSLGDLKLAASNKKITMILFICDAGGRCHLLSFPCPVFNIFIVCSSRITNEERREIGRLWCLLYCCLYVLGRSLDFILIATRRAQKNNNFTSGCPLN